MSDFKNLKRIATDKPGSFAEMRRLQRVIKSGDLDEIAALLADYGVDVDSIAVDDLPRVVQAIAQRDESSPLPTTDGPM